MFKNLKRVLPKRLFAWIQRPVGGSAGKGDGAEFGGPDAWMATGSCGNSIYAAISLS